MRTLPIRRRSYETALPKSRLGRASQPASGDTVFIDTSAMFVDDSRRPLLLLSFGGYLDVCWSPYVAGEVARVATREQAVTTSTRAPQNLPRQLTADLESRRHEIDRVIADHEQRWRSPDPAGLRSVLVENPNLPVADPNDHPILAAAMAVWCSVPPHRQHPA